MVSIACLQVAAQKDSTASKSWTLSGFCDFYYGATYNKPPEKSRPDFIYNHSRDREMSLNLLFAKAAYTSKMLRANVAIMTGTYAATNLAAEPGWARYIYEANAGTKLSAKHDLWLDLGIMPSHLGFESAKNTDCQALTRSMVAENSPYYETGAKLNYTSGNGKWYAAILALNGWQKIAKPIGQSKLSAGMQVTYKPNEKLLLNYGNFIGSDKPDTANATRVYHNIYTICKPSQKTTITIR